MGRRDCGAHVFFWQTIIPSWSRGFARFSNRNSMWPGRSPRGEEVRHEPTRRVPEQWRAFGREADSKPDRPGRLARRGRQEVYRARSRSFEVEVDIRPRFSESQAKLRRSVPGVVISDHDLSNGYCWKDLLQELGVLEDPPPLIVVTRLADDFLWAEVLNLGAHDLLAKPFDKRDVLHAVSTASRTARTNALCGRSGEFPFWGKLAAKPKRVPRLTHRKYRQRPARDKS
jgi:CheY-like chemotaxis protein